MVSGVWFERCVCCEYNLTSLFMDNAAYFKCTIEDAEAGVYGDVGLVHQELLDYLETKKQQLIDS